MNFVRKNPILVTDIDKSKFVEVLDMKRIMPFVLVITMLLTFSACSNSKKDIEGTIIGYVQVEEYNGPIAIIESNGTTVYFATSILKTAVEADQNDDTLLEAIKDGDITNIKVSINEAETGKTIDISGNKVTVWQSHQIHKTDGG